MPYVSVEEFEKSLGQDRLQISSMEDVLVGLNSIYGRVSTEGICRSDALYLQQVDPLLLKGLPPNGFTALPSKTHLNLAMEAMDAKKAGTIAAIVAAVAAVLYKIYRWITGGSSDGVSMIEASAEKVAEAEEKVEASATTLTETISEATEPQVAKKKADELFNEMVSADDFQKHCSELTDKLSVPGSALLKQLQHLMTEIIPKVHDLVKSTIDHYNDLAKGSTADVDFSQQNHDAVVSQVLLKGAIANALQHVNSQLDKLGLASSATPAAARKTLTTANLTSQVYQELQRLSSQPSELASKLNLQDVKKNVSGADMSGMLERLDQTTKRVAGPIGEGKVDDLLITDIKWSQEIMDDKEKLKKMEQTLQQYRMMIQDLATVVSKLYSSVKFAADRYVEYLHAIHAVQVKIEKELRE